MLFDWGGEGEATPAAPAGMGGGLSGLLGGIFHAAASSSGAAPDTGRGVELSKEDKEATYAAGQYEPLACGLFILGMTALVGDLAPNEETARAVVIPLLRILARHIDPMRKLSPDVRDALASAGAFAIYVAAIWPALKARRAESGVQRAKQKGQSQRAAGNQPGASASNGGGASGNGGMPAAGGARGGAVTAIQSARAGEPGNHPAAGEPGHLQRAVSGEPVNAGEGTGRHSVANDVAALYLEDFGVAI